jgi:hypothetical protein
VTLPSAQSTAGDGARRRAVGAGYVEAKKHDLGAPPSERPEASDSTPWLKSV